MRRALAVLLSALLAFSGVPGFAASRQVRATSSPPTEGVACDIEYDDAYLFDVATGNQFYCDLGLWQKRTPGGGNGWAKGIDFDLDGTNGEVTTDGTDDVFVDPDHNGTADVKISPHALRVYASGDYNPPLFEMVGDDTSDACSIHMDSSLQAPAFCDAAQSTMPWSFDDVYIGGSLGVVGIEAGVPDGPSGEQGSLGGTTNWFASAFASAFQVVSAGAVPLKIYRHSGNVDSNSDGTADLDPGVVFGNLSADGTNDQRYCFAAGGYGGDPFDYTTSFCMEVTASGEGSFYPITGDAYNGLSFPTGDLGKSTRKWRNGYFSALLSVGTATFNDIGYSNSYANGNYWSGAGNQYWITDNDFNDTAKRNYEWFARTDDDANGTSTDLSLMKLDRTAQTACVNADGGTTCASGAELIIDASANTAAFDPAGDGTPAWKFCEDTPVADEVAYYDNAAGCWKAQPQEQLGQARPYRYVELFEDFLRPGSGNDTNTSELFVTSDSTVQLHQITNNGTTIQSFDDADGTATLYGIGWAYTNTGTGTGGQAFAGFGAKNPATEPSSLSEAVFQLKKMRLFRARWSNNFYDTNENADLLIGGVGETARGTNLVSVSPDSRDTGAYFVCHPDLDLDDDGTAGDAEDDNVWAVLDLNLGVAGDTVCLINGGAGCTPSANRTAVDTGRECTGVASTDTRGFIYTVEIEYDGAGNWIFRLDDDNDDGTWDWTSTTTFNGKTPSDADSVMIWGVAMENNAQAVNKAIYMDYLYYYGIRF